MTEVRDRIRRRWWVVLLCVLVAVGGALVTGLGATTTYTSKASLTTYSANRAPEQDAVLIQSYVDLFTSDAGQQSLRRDARIPDDITVTAMPVATGPIMFVVASGPDPAAVARAAQTMADGFRQSINAGVQRTRQAALDALRKPFADREADNDFILQQERIQLQQSVDRLNSDTSGLLQNLTAATAPTADRPAMTARLAVSVVVGLLVGLVLAWLVGGLAPRLRTAAGVREVSGLRTFDASGDGGRPPRADAARRQRARLRRSAGAVGDSADRCRRTSRVGHGGRRTGADPRRSGCRGRAGAHDPGRGVRRRRDGRRAAHAGR